jgi:predicted ATP-dependent endonuclease of OLD family
LAKINIKVVSIAFGPQPFRKLENLTVNFAERLTLIAGHNGIGKSTILALTTNIFGLSQNPKFKSYFDHEFYCNIEQMMHIDVTEVDSAQKAKATPPRITCKVNDLSVVKECSLTRRNVYQRARVVPRTLGKKPVSVDGLEIGPDAKIPLPTIHLGIKRMLPAGEALEKEVFSSFDKTIHEDDSKLIASFINSVVVGGNANHQGITSQSIKGARKVSKHPGYQHDPRAISLGQDSLGSIATALASFNRLKREMQDDYPGGLLVIDELDAGFHPHAIGRLAEALKTNAKKLNIQIIATTHSPRLIEAIHPDGDGNALSPDAVVYLHDTVQPRLAPDQSLHAILSDMSLKPVQEKKVNKLKVPVYFEDEEAAQFFSELFSRMARARITRRHNVKLDLLPLGVGGSNFAYSDPT